MNDLLLHPFLPYHHSLSASALILFYSLSPFNQIPPKLAIRKYFSKKYDSSSFRNCEGQTYLSKKHNLSYYPKKGNMTTIMRISKHSKLCEQVWLTKVHLKTILLSLAFHRPQSSTTFAGDQTTTTMLRKEMYITLRTLSLARLC